MQSTWAIGEMIAAGVVALVLPRFGWRAVFFVGVLPALIVFWIRRDVPESELWLAQQKTERRGSLRLLCAMFGYWGLFTSGSRPTCRCPSRRAAAAST